MRDRAVTQNLGPRAEMAGPKSPLRGPECVAAHGAAGQTDGPNHLLLRPRAKPKKKILPAEAPSVEVAAVRFCSSTMSQRPDDKVPLGGGSGYQ